MWSKIWSLPNLISEYAADIDPNWTSQLWWIPKPSQKISSHTKEIIPMRYFTVFEFEEKYVYEYYMTIYVFKTVQKED